MSSPPSGGSTSWDSTKRRASDSQVVSRSSAGSAYDAGLAPPAHVAGNDDPSHADPKPPSSSPAARPASSTQSSPQPPPPPAAAVSTSSAGQPPSLEINVVLPSPALGDEGKGDASTHHHHTHFVRSLSSSHHHESSSASSTSKPYRKSKNHSNHPPLHSKHHAAAPQMDNPSHEYASPSHQGPTHPPHPGAHHHPQHHPPTHGQSRHALHPQPTHAAPPHPPAHPYPLPSDYLAATHAPPIPTTTSISQQEQQLRYADQAYGSLRPVYPPQMYYDPSIAAAAAAAAAAADYAVDPTHAYPGIPSRASQAPVPPQFHPSTTTTPIPQGAWTSSPMPPQAPFFGSYGGMAPQLATQHSGGPSPMTEDLARNRSLYLPHTGPPPPSGWSASTVLSSHYQYFSPFTTSTERMENMSPVAETWSPGPQSRQLPARPSYVAPSQTGAWGATVPRGTAAASAAVAAGGQPGREHRGSWSAPSARGEEGLAPPRPSQHAIQEGQSQTQHDRERERERKEYHPQPPARRSEWVMWVGNVPSNVSHEELWRFFNTTTPPSAMSNPSEPWRGPSSIFLISRSSCAFVNFSSQADLDRAVPFFHGLSLRPWDPRCPRMVCRVRHKDDDLRAGVGAQRGVGMHRQWVEQQKQAEKAISPKAPNLELPDNPHSQSSSSNHKSSASFASTNSSFLVHHFPKRYFILKSLTITDLEDAVKTCQWKTQRHNQPILDQAFRTSQEVYLIFGANRSGEFFGYAKMVGPSLRIHPPAERGAHGRSSFGGSISSLAPLSIGQEEGRAARAQLSTPVHATPIHEEGEPEGPLPTMRSATDPYFRRKSTAFLHPGQRAASPGPIDEEDELLSPFVNLQVSPQVEQEGLFRSESPEMFEDALRKASVNTLDPNLLRGRRESTRYSQMRYKEGSSSLQIPVGGGGSMPRKESIAVPRKETMDPAKADEGSADGLAAPFRLQWIKVAPLSFFRTRHLRNPWNGDREVKVSRDGTEVEPNVGALLISEWEKLESSPDPSDDAQTTKEGDTRATKEGNGETVSSPTSPKIRVGGGGPGGGKGGRGKGGTG